MRPPAAVSNFSYSQAIVEPLAADTFSDVSQYLTILAADS
jgi:hypothetical protein